MSDDIAGGDADTAAAEAIRPKEPSGVQPFVPARSWPSPMPLRLIESGYVAVTLGPGCLLPPLRP